MNSNLTDFWAKTTPDGMPGISVYNHMVNVGCVAQCIAETSQELLSRFYMRSSEIGALAALHDLGKISPGFQRKCIVWLQENDLVAIERNSCWDSSMEPDHGKVSHAAIQIFLTESGFDRTTANFISTVLGGHHGRLSRPNDRGYRPQKGIIEAYSGIDWALERKRNAQKVWDQFAEGDTNFSLSDDSSSLWWLAGLTSVADWIGSDERFFSPERAQKDKNVFPSHARHSIQLVYCRLF